MAAGLSDNLRWDNSLRSLSEVGEVGDGRSTVLHCSTVPSCGGYKGWCSGHAGYWRFRGSAGGELEGGLGKNTQTGVLTSLGVLQ